MHLPIYHDPGEPIPNKPRQRFSHPYLTGFAFLILSISIRGIISFFMYRVAGYSRVPNPATGMMAFRMRCFGLLARGCADRYLLQTILFNE
jgi:hypothetical protein